MVKKNLGVKALFLFFFLLLNLLGVLLYLPLHFYKTVIKDGLNSPYLKLPSSSQFGTNFYLRPNKALPSSSDGQVLDNKWNTFHYRDFSLPLPLRHPEYITLPYIFSEKGEDFIGLKIISPKGDELLKFVQSKPFRFDFSRGNNKVFYLPIYEQQILAKNKEDLWAELFTRNISTDYLWAKNEKEMMAFFLDIKHQDLVLNLYVLYLRHQFFASSTQLIHYEPLRKIGIADDSSHDLGKAWKKEIWYFFSEGLVYSMTIFYNGQEQSAIRAKNEIFYNINLLPTFEASSITLYNEFQSLPYQRKIDQEGMIYLMSAWTHVTHNKQFLRQMIQFLERGKENALHLTSLYEYSLRHYGTSFSSISKEYQEREEPSAKLERKMQEELQKEINEAKNSGPDSEGNFKNEDEKVQYYLKKAKENKESNLNDEL